jgi:REP element-mobilizing transposase RayT
MTESVIIPKGWHSRGYLPHFDGGEVAQTVTFRLADSLPRSVLERWEIERAHLESKNLETERRRRIQDYLDKGQGMAWMKDRRVARLVQAALLHFDGERYKLPAWVVMPNHVHVLLIPMFGYALADIVHSWKSFTSNEANKLLGRGGDFWQPDYFDRFIRNGCHYEDAIDYIESNPVKAGLCTRNEDWEFSSARVRVENVFESF